MLGCLSAGAADQAPMRWLNLAKGENPNLAQDAKLTASSETIARSRRYVASKATDGQLQFSAVMRDWGTEVTMEWIAKSDKQEWLTLQWDKPVEVREVVYFSANTWEVPVFKDYEIYLGDAKTPVGKGSLQNHRNVQSILLDKAYKTKELTIKFLNAHGNRNSGVNEIMIFSRPASMRDMLKGLYADWNAVVDDTLLPYRLAKFDITRDIEASDVKNLIAEMQKVFGEDFNAKRYNDLLAKATQSDAQETYAPQLLNPYLAPLQLLTAQILFFGEEKDIQRVIAFPGAEGFGAYTTGGRGGRVIFVTNLNNSGPGSLRAAIREKGPRTVIFRVSGTIKLLKNDETPDPNLRISNPNITIAGQSAPGDGICLAGGGIGLNAGADNVIIRHIRSRPGDCGWTAGTGISGRFFQNAIIDHCSMSWAMDQVCTFYNNSHVTIQWCIIAEGLHFSRHVKRHGHSCGIALGGMNTTMHHCLNMSSDGRNPLVGGIPDSTTEFRSSVLYNWVYTASLTQGSYNYVDNYYKPGPSMKERAIFRNYAGHAYVARNFFEGSPEITEDNWKGIQNISRSRNPAANTPAKEPFPYAKITAHSAKEAYELVLNNAGATLPRRDAVDKRLVSEVRSGKKGKIINHQKEVGGWPELKTYDVPVDTDNDGMPDAWEKNFGLNPNDPADNVKDLDGDGFTNIEEWLNSTDATKVDKNTL